jgi:hypothetical protein
LKRKAGAIAIVLLSILIYKLTYIPHKIINIDPDNISKISICERHDESPIEITNRNDIKHIINNLNNITFKKEKLLLINLGYGYDITIYNYKGDVTKYFTIQYENTIIYRGTKYKAQDYLIDYDYIDNLIDTKHI